MILHEGLRIHMCDGSTKILNQDHYIKLNSKKKITEYMDTQFNNYLFYRGCPYDHSDFVIGRNNKVYVEYGDCRKKIIIGHIYPVESGVLQ